MDSRKLILNFSLLMGVIHYAHAVTTPSLDATQKADARAIKPLTLSSFFSPTPEMNFVSINYTFSGATSDYINYIRLCNATDNTCGTCNTSVTSINTGVAIPYADTGTTYYVSSASVASYLAMHSLDSGVYNIGMYVQSAAACSGSYCSTDSDSSDQILCMQATYDGTNVTTLAQSDNGSAQLTTPAFPAISITAPTQAERVIAVNSVTPLQITISNESFLVNANNVQATLPASWTDVTQDASDCTSIAPGASCELKLTSTAPYEPDQITISGSNTQNAPLSTYIAFSDGGGLVFYVQGGTVKVVDTAEVYSTKVQWHAPTATGPSNAYDLFDGAANTAAIVAFFGNTHDYAAALCVDSSVGGYSDWYLPAMCELGRYLGVGNDPSCGTISNLLTTLHQIGFGQFITINSSIHSQAYWSSTNNPSYDPRAVWNQNFTDLSISNASGENQYKEARCVRSFAG